MIEASYERCWATCTASVRRTPSRNSVPTSRLTARRNVGVACEVRAEHLDEVEETVGDLRCVAAREPAAIAANFGASGSETSIGRPASSVPLA